MRRLAAVTAMCGVGLVLTAAVHVQQEQAYVEVDFTCPGASNLVRGVDWDNHKTGYYGEAGKQKDVTWKSEGGQVGAHGWRVLRATAAGQEIRCEYRTEAP